MDAENQFRTKTVQDNLSPKWNHVDYFRVYRNDDDIQFNLFDEDVDADDDLGKVSYFLFVLENFKLKQKTIPKFQVNIRLADISDDWQDWLDLEGVKQGKLKIKIEKLYPADENLKKVRSDVEASRLVQFYVGELKGNNSNRKVLISDGLGWVV